LDRTEVSVGDMSAAIEDVRTSLDRMSRLLQRLQHFVRKEERVLEAIDVEALVAEVRAAAAPMLRDVDVETVTEGRLHAFGVPSLVREILLNLAANAATAARSLPSPRVRFHVYSSGDRIVVSVRDNGLGIAPDKQDKIFDPFYTTHRPDGAVGLGLAICREYATHMGAELSFWTAPHRGACFRLHLRRVDAPTRRT
jgi:C4-dicarboxylate-specific signal transduction histidine kinase